MRGPYDRVVFRPSTGARTYYQRKSWFRSDGKVYVKPLPYDMYEATSSLGDAPNNWIAHQIANDWPPSGAMSNKALDKFVESFKGSSDAALAVTFAEWRQSVNMIANRSLQILAMAVSLRRGRIPRWARRDPRTIRSESKSWSKRWLEFHFGWSPLYQDMYNACQVIGGPLGRIRSRGKAHEDRFVSSNGISGHFRVGVSMQADVHLVNPNLALANRLGLINPAGVAWELVPYSFVVDWLIPIGGFLNGVTDYVGYDVLNPQTTTYRRGTGGHPARPEVGYGTCVHVVRELHLPSRKLVVNRFPSGLSLSRAATSVALLTKFLRSKA